eukprot:TRINITY_DN862_c0_g1_i2.p1 TRINITY_DN862_c0_g1~~TRINITY_DN862_c0_g1_i2.p1  ORF type:complete len:122 (-),score=30.12 TRINITY_DN862_c0_g1_i2:52-417(-)
MLGDVAMDLRNKITSLAYNPNYEMLKGSMLKDYLPTILPRLEKFIAGKKFLLGDKPTWPDFVFFELFDQLGLMFPGLFEKDFPHLKAFIGNVKALPEIDAYLKSDRVVKPINNRMAAFGAS